MPYRLLSRERAIVRVDARWLFSCKSLEKYTSVSVTTHDEKTMRLYCPVVLKNFAKAVRVQQSRDEEWFKRETKAGRLIPLGTLGEPLTEA